MARSDPLGEEQSRRTAPVSPRNGNASIVFDVPVDVELPTVGRSRQAAMQAAIEKYHGEEIDQEMPDPIDFAAFEEMQRLADAVAKRRPAPTHRRSNELGAETVAECASPGRKRSRDHDFEGTFVLSMPRGSANVRHGLERDAVGDGLSQTTDNARRDAERGVGRVGDEFGTSPCRERSIEASGPAPRQNPMHRVRERDVGSIRRGPERVHVHVVSQAKMLRRSNRVDDDRLVHHRTVERRIF